MREIQLLLTPEQYQTYKEMVGREVLAKGTLFGAHDGITTIAGFLKATSAYRLVRQPAKGHLPSR